MTPQVLNSCSLCALKKRKCDRAYPVCSRCFRSKREKECIYDNPSDKRVAKSLSAQRSEPGPLRSTGACERCRTRKRACDREYPACSSCKRLGIPCEYNKPAARQLTHGLITQAQQALFGRRLLSSSQGIDNLQLMPQYPIPARNHFPLLIHHYCVASLLPESHRLPNSLTTHLHTTWMIRAMADPCLFHATLFCASAHLDLLQGKPHSRMTVFHQSCAMMALRERLKGGKISYETAATALALVYYNMTAFDTETALIHKQGILQMLVINKDRGPDFMGLAGLVNLILLGVAVVMNQQPPEILAISDPTGLSLSTVHVLARPSNLLSVGLIRSRKRKSGILTNTSMGQLQNVLNFIIAAENPSSRADAPQQQRSLHLIRPPEPAPTAPDFGAPSTKLTTIKTAQNINHCVHLVCSIFWTLVLHGLQPAEPEVSEPSPSSSFTSDTVRRSPLRALHGVISKIDHISWQKHAPELYIWICLTAAAACDTPSARIPFIAAVTPIVSASDSADLLLTRDSWRYFEWLAGFRCRS
ncbi:hypothetical protein ASPCAL14246 [Aspergillus calidoustus]|uniref:Zn(2)-C6 fungal-type domain-containing protein n=1 Tax=Aspergillus calidoustus TaxID=454130 RepID=A0A0U4ZP89_ASPCI|nr:hypothetical protein ASPCAL14246 [Aspergillus calidoustus]